MSEFNGSELEALALLRLLVLGAQRDLHRLLGEALAPLGVTPAQAEVLTVLAPRPPLSLQALGERLVCETGSPSRLVATLVRVGWVRRRAAADDARRIELSLTPAGAALADRVQAAEAELLAELGAVLQGQPPGPVNETLWRLVAHLPAGRALRLRLAEERRGAP